MPTTRIKTIIFKVTERQHRIIQNLAEKLNLLNMSEAIRQVLLDRAAKEGVKE
jgi:hypothetical protein